jgi:glyoxylase-like metal-dependent hydrolase (beta-lactamase superfamily II)
MLKPVVAALACAALLTVSTAVAQAPSAAPSVAPAPPAPIAIKPVKPGLYMVTGAGGNVTVRVGADSLIVVDTKNYGQKNFDDLMAQIRTISPKPVKHVFLTHVHADHTGNTGSFIAAGATVIANEHLPTYLAAMQPPANNPNWVRPAAPNATYKSKLEVEIPGARAIGLHFTPAHTGGDTIVFFPDVKVVAMGDELTDRPPNIDYANGASLKGWITSFDEVLKLDFDTAIPGHHDNPMTKADLKATRDKFATLLARGQAAVKAGASKEELMSKIKVDDLGWTLNPAQWAPGPRLDGFWKEISG